METPRRDGPPLAGAADGEQLVRSLELGIHCGEQRVRDLADDRSREDPARNGRRARADELRDLDDRGRVPFAWTRETRDATRDPAERPGVGERVLVQGS
jgi:hypothetical protein